MSRLVRSYLLIGLLAIQAATVLGIVLVTRATSSNALEEQMDATLVRAADGAAEASERFLDPAAQAAALTAASAESGVIPLDDPATLEAYFLDQLEVNPQFAGMYVGFPDGSFVYTSRDETRSPDGFRTKVITPGSPPRSTLQWLAPDGSVVAAEEDPDDTYDPRTRPWYQLAQDSDGVVWTDPYVFFTSQQPGATAAAAITAPDGSLVGVAGVDIELATLSTFVAGLDVSPAGSAFIIDRNGSVLAAGDEDVVRGEGEESRPATVDEIEDPDLARAFAAADDRLADAEESFALDFESGGDAHRVRFDLVENQPAWLIGVVAPESDFVGAILENERLNALIAVAIALAAVVVAIPAVWLVARWIQGLNDKASTDPLTGLTNRRRFDELLERAVAEATSRQHPLSVAFIDVDHFKGINDTYGHGVGDEALIAVAKRLEHSVRSSDVVGRLGGDEFAVLLPSADLALAAEILERARAGLAEAPTATSGGAIDITLTIGVADLGPERDAVDSLVAAADAALYVAKRSGRNRVATVDEVELTPAGDAGSTPPP